FRRAKVGHFVVGTTQFEAEDRLCVFTLEQHPVANSFRHLRCEVEVRFNGNVIHPGGQDALQVIGGHIGKWRRRKQARKNSMSKQEISNSLRYTSHPHLASSIPTWKPGCIPPFNGCLIRWPCPASGSVPSSPLHWCPPPSFPWVPNRPSSATFRLQSICSGRRFWSRPWATL